MPTDRSSGIVLTIPVNDVKMLNGNYSLFHEGLLG